jgi:cytochrome P450
MSVAELSINGGLTALLCGDASVTHDPYPFYRRLREEAPVHRLGSLVFISTHAEVKAAYLDKRRLFNKSRETTGPGEALSLLSDVEKQMYHELLEFELGYISRKDGLDHARIRSAVQPAFTPRRIAELEEVARQLTDELLDELSRQETPDLIELAHRLPLLVITSMLGVPRKDADLLKGWGDDIIERRRRLPVQPVLIQRAMRGLTEYRAYVSKLVEHSRWNTANHLAAALMAAEEGERLTRDELVATYALILFAGHETTTNLIGNGVLALLEHRDQWRLLCDDPSLAPGAVEEAFRYDAPVQISLRTAVVDLKLNGVEIPVGTPLWLLIGSANRDPKAFSNPDDLDITRSPNDHLGLGHGVHFCLGGPLARLQGQVVLSALAQRFPGTELARAPDTLARSTGVSMRGLISLPVKLRT